jgi:hypothetical protein
MSIPTVMGRGLALWCPGATHGGLQHETGLVNKDNRTAFTPGFFYPWPVLGWPLRNSLLVAFTGTLLGFLGTRA